MVNLPARPQRECRVPVRPGNVYGEQRHPVEQLRDIESASCWRQTVGEAVTTVTEPTPIRPVPTCLRPSRVI